MKPKNSWVGFFKSKVPFSCILGTVIGGLFLCMFLALILKSRGRIVEQKDFFFNTDQTEIQNDLSGYKSFIEKNKGRFKPITREVYLNQIEEAQAYLKNNPQGKMIPDIKKKIIDELRIDFLLKDIERRDLTVTIVAERRGNGFLEKDMLFKDPQVGTFLALMLLPDRKKTDDLAIIGLHGHDGSSSAFATLVGEKLAKEGFTVLMPSFRAFSIRNDVVMDEALRFNGFTLAGLRVYETLLLIKYLNYKRHKGIAVMGHSGGSIVAFWTAMLNPDIKALILDQKPDPLSLLTAGEQHCEILNSLNSHSHLERYPGNAFPHCDTLPGLAYYAPQISRGDDLKVPFMEFKYGYPEPGDFKTVVAFINEKLVGKKS